MQACYRAARAAYNLKQYNKALMLAEQGIAQDAGASELKRIQQVTSSTHRFLSKVVQTMSFTCDCLSGASCSCRMPRAICRLKSKEVWSEQPGRNQSGALHSN